MTETRVLVTGFEPFDGDAVNPALEAAKQLHGRRLQVGPRTVSIQSEPIPTVFHKSIQVLRQAIVRHRPDVVVAVGQAGGRYAITPERVAINVDDARIPDNEGQQPVDEPIVPDGPAAYFSRLPIKRIVQTLREAGIPAAVSNTAGTYVCNHLFYGLMHLLATEFPGVRGGFIHIPFLPEQTVQREAPSMSLSDIVRGLEFAVQVSAEYATDVPLTAGREC
ncbi:pyroglutamyl-peptidase I [Alicyclobacillus herbarius]|uniref:pyroglutamyl-peptidase I n=1 Tax=Alicyclobacillus herbarius TaxID=122960 RepID=UPI00040C371B|nr:pyroglutamyl-peptidase I [Alicyclobacillus herbarius]